MENLDDLLLSINAAVWHMHFPSREFIYINQHLSDICGIKLSRLKRDPEIYNSLIHPEDKDRVLKEFKKVIEGNSIEIEYRIITTAGTKWIYHKEMMLCDPNGKFETLAGIISDITLRKEAEVKTAESEQHYRYLFTNNPNPLWIYDVETLKFLAVNDAAIEIYGYTRNEFLSMTIADIRPLEDVDRLKEEVKKVDLNYRSSQYWKHLKKNGAIMRVRVSSHGLRYEGHKASMVLITDLTDILTAQDELDITSNNLKALINNTDDLIYSVDTNYRLMAINRGYRNHINTLYDVYLSEGDLVFPDTVSEDFIVKWKSIYDRCLKGENFSLIEEYQVRDKKLIHEIRFNTMYDNSGTIIGASCFIHDISRRINNEKEIIAQNKLLREIASLASHDIRGHVTSILGILTLMHREELGQLNTELLAYIQQASENLDVVIHKIVDKSSKLTNDDLPYTWRSTKSISE